MYPYPSTQFQSAITQSHSVAIRVEVWPVTGTSPLVVAENVQDNPTTPTPSLVVTDGSVTFDKSSDQRSQCSVTFNSPDGTMVPTSNTSPLTPWGNELRIYRGVYYTSGSLAGTSEYVPLGCFRISKVEVADDAGEVKMTVTGYDRSRNISRNVVPFYWPDFATQSLILNHSWANMIQVALADRWAPITFNDTIANWTALQNDPVNGSVPNFLQSFSEGTDLFDQMRQYAQAAGCDLFFTRDGVCKMYRDPNFSNMSANNTSASLAVATFSEGVSAVFDKVTRTLDDSAAYNYVVVYGEGDILGTPLFNYPPIGTPVVDNDPSSPTYVGTPNPDGTYTGAGSTYGLVPHIVTNNLLSSLTMVNNFAQLQLVVDIGAQQGVTIPSMVCNPCLDVDDVIIIERERIGLTQGSGYVVSNVQIPLVAKTNQQLTVREKRNLVLS